MKIVLESFVNVCHLLALLIPFGSFTLNAIYSPNGTRSQRSVQFFLMIAFFFMISYRLQLLRSIYSGKDGNAILSGKLKVLQYIGENLLHSVICHALAILLGAFENFKVNSITDQKAMQLSTYIYGYVRCLPAALILFKLTGDVELYSFLMDILLTAENAVLILIFSSIVHIVNKVMLEIDVCLMRDKAVVLYFLGKCRTTLTSLATALFMEFLAKMLYLAAMLGSTSRGMAVANDISNLFRVISIYLILRSVVSIVFIDFKSFKVVFNEAGNERFFVFTEDDENAADNEANKSLNSTANNPVNNAANSTAGAENTVPTA